MDGRSFALDAERVLLGRDPSADVRFDAERDRKVSARHAELVRLDGGWRIRDLGSTNGTFRNGGRIASDAPLQPGDRIMLGEGGPALLVHFEAPPPPPPPPPPPSHPPAAGGAGAPQRVAPPARRLSLRARNIAVGTGLVLLAAIGIAFTMTALVRARDAQRSAGGAADTTGSASLDGASRQGAAALPGAEMDYATIASENSRAVALVAVEMPGGDASSGTAFAVGDRLLVTNRHVVQVADGPRARRVLVKFSETESWIPAHVDRVDAASDLATLLLESPATAPRVVRGIAAPGTDPRVGDPVALIGYPLGTDTPMESDDDDFIAAPSVFRGMVSKSLADVLQVDAFAGQGSSGSPVLDSRGAVVGVVYGGPRDAGGRIAYAVPMGALLRFLAADEVPRVP